MNGRVDAILDRLISVKLWSAIAGVVLVVIYGDDIEIKGQEIQGALAVGLPALLLVVQGIVDALKGQRPTK